MISFINKFRIPTLLGLSIIMAGIIAGIFLVLNQTAFISQADPSNKPQNVIISNIDGAQVVISWETPKAVASFVKHGEGETFLKTALDDRDKTQPTIRQIHYVTLTNLKPRANYSFKIMPGEFTSDNYKFQTAAPATQQNGFVPVVGVILDGEKPLDDGTAYLSIGGAVTQSALIRSSGNFLIPLSFIRKVDLSDVYTPSEDHVAKLMIISQKGQASALFKLKSSGQPLPPIKLGQNVDFVNPEVSPSPTPTAQELNKYDLNEDGFINANDHAIVLKNFGPLGREASKNPKEKRADLNSDGVVDQKDLDLMNKKINQ